MLEAKNIDIIISTKYLIRSLSLTLKKGDKLAVIGEEGNGKSTLLRSLIGLCEYAKISGTINLKGNTIGYLEQTFHKEQLNQIVFDYLFLNSEEYYNKISSFYHFLEDLHLDDSILEQHMSNLSGGEKVKIGLLKLLLNDYDILFLDEPTNDLDIETLKWLEEFILKTNKPIMYVSHDETLLSKTANMILHLEQIKKKTECRHTLLKIDYDTYIMKRMDSISKQRQEAKSEQRKYNIQKDKLNRVLKKVEYQQNTISRKDPHGAKVLKKKMHSLKSQEKKLESMDLKQIPDLEESVFFQFEEINIPKNKIIIQLEFPEFKIDNKVILKNIKLDINHNTHLCIIGKNGSGKTTLLKCIYEKLKNRKDIIVGYMPQFYDEILGKYHTVLDFMTDNQMEDTTKIRKYLANMNFTNDEVLGKIDNLSNGTKAKLILVKLVMKKCQVLILDEPTRNVSPLTNPVIRKVLKDFSGTIISVSHDRKYIEEVMNEVYILMENGLIKEK